MSFVVGVIECGGSMLYCMVLFFDLCDGFVVKYCKLMLIGIEWLIWG